MNTPNLIITAITGILSVALFVLLIQFFSRKINHEQEGKLKAAYGIWTGFLTIGFGILLASSLKSISNALAILLNEAKTESTLPIIRNAALFTGFTFLWFTGLYFLTRLMAVMLLGKRTDSIEIDRNNYNYFLIKGIIFLAFVFSLLSVFENFLLLFSPVVKTPFYH